MYFVASVTPLSFGYSLISLVILFIAFSGFTPCSNPLNTNIALLNLKLILSPELQTGSYLPLLDHSLCMLQGNLKPSKSSVQLTAYCVIPNCFFLLFPLLCSPFMWMASSFTSLLQPKVWTMPHMLPTVPSLTISNHLPIL